jgi:uncharacterized membrane protein
MPRITRWPAVLGAGLLTVASWLALITGSASAATTPGAAAAPTAHVTLIDPASPDSNAGAINDSGTVIGTDDSGAFWYDRTGLHRLVPPAGSSAIVPLDINDRGDILAQTLGDPSQVYLWRGGRWTFIGDGSAAGMNERGQILVEVGTAAASFELWQDGHSTAINAPDVTGTPSLTGGYLNQAGQVAFSSRDAGTGNPIEAWLWTAGRYTRLPALVPGANAQVSGLNDLGEVIGQSGNTANLVDHIAVIWQHGKVHQLATPAAPGTSVTGDTATGINDLGEVVGTYSTLTEPPQQAALWPATTAPATLLDPGAWATDPEISQAGQVIFGVTEVAGIGQYQDEAMAWRDGQLADIGPGFPVAQNQPGEVSMDSESSGTFQAALATIDWGT